MKLRLSVLLLGITLSFPTTAFPDIFKYKYLPKYDYILGRLCYVELYNGVKVPRTDIADIVYDKSNENGVSGLAISFVELYNGRIVTNHDMKSVIFCTQKYSFKYNIRSYKLKAKGMHPSRYMLCSTKNKEVYGFKRIPDTHKTTLDPTESKTFGGCSGGG